MAKIVGLAGIDKAIKAIAGVGANLNERVQETAVAIVEHAAGAGNGDVSRALTLCQTVAKMRTLDVGFLVGWFAAFAGTNVQLKKGTVSLFAKDSKKQRGFRVDEARANNWYEAFNDAGERSPWYQGPDRPPFQPDSVGDIADYLMRQTKRLFERLDGEKEVNGKTVPLVKVSKAEREQIEEALHLIETIANRLARHEDIATLVNKTANDEMEEAEEAVA